MSSVGSRMDAIHPLLKVQFEDLCSSVGNHCASLLSGILEGCVHMSEKIKAEPDAKSQSLVKLYFSNVLNDVHYTCIKQLDYMAQYFREVAQIDAAVIDRNSEDNSKIIHSLMWQLSSTKEKTASDKTERGSKLDKKLELAQDISLCRSDHVLRSTSSYIEKYQNYLEERANSSTPLIMKSSKSSHNDTDAFQDKSRLMYGKHSPGSTFRPAIGSSHRQQYSAFDLFKKSPIVIDKPGIDM